MNTRISIRTAIAGLGASMSTIGMTANITARKKRKNGVFSMTKTLNGAALMAALTDAAEAAGCERIMLEVRADNAPAMAMYKKYGFSEISVRRGYYGGVDAIIMERSLAVLF